MSKYEVQEQETMTRVNIYYVEAETEDEAYEIVSQGEAEPYRSDDPEPFEWEVTDVRLMGDDE